jgi:hypothetical protein
MKRPHIKHCVLNSRARIDEILAKDKAWRAARSEADQLARWAELIKGQDTFDSLPAEEFFAVHDRKRKRKRQARKERQQKRRAIRRAEYEAYINSPEWKAFRVQIFAERGRTCQDCGKQTGVMHLHHLHYRNFQHEKPEDVRVLCENCHEAVHSGKARAESLTAQKAAAARWGKK